MSELLEITGLTKSFGGTVVLNNVDLTVKSGEVRALLGENGAGKSTLIKILAGIHHEDSGTVQLDGQERHFRNPHDAVIAGIATVHQELMISPGLSVAENVLLGTKIPTRLGKIAWGELNRTAEKWFAELGQSIDVRRPVDELSAVEMTMTAIARALCLDAKVLILDEPTAALTDSEVHLLFATVKRLRERGMGIIYVSHRLEEVFVIADTFTVLRNGSKVSEGKVSETNIPQIINSMAGREVSAIFPDRSIPGSEEILSVHDLAAKKIKGVNFTVKAGETFGIGGLAGSGRSEILRVLAGAQRRTAGTIELHGSAYQPKGIGSAQGQRVVLVPQERRRDGLVPGSILSNIVITTLSKLTNFGFFSSTSMERKMGKAAWEKFDIRGKSLSQEIFTLSGGNQQKVVLAKFLALTPSLLLIDEPTKGVDVTTRSEIYRLLAELAANGMSIIVVSSELTELLAISHRVLVMHEGRQISILESSTTTEAEALLACYGRTA